MLKQILFKFINGLSRWESLSSQKDYGVTAVCFHRISDEIDNAYPSMSVSTFENLIKHFLQNYSIISTDEIGSVTPKPKLIITFDDGYKDFITNALPILVKNKVPALMHVVVNTVLSGEAFWTQNISCIVNKKLKLGEDLKVDYGDHEIVYKITTSNAENIALEIYAKLIKLDSDKRESIIEKLPLNEIDKRKVQMMNVDDLKTCIKNNITIGSHSFTHENMSLNLSKKQLNKELVESKAVLDKTLNTSIENFAFPNGLGNEKLLEFLHNAGYRNIFTTKDSLYTPNPGSLINIIPRIILFGDSVDENILRTNLFHIHVRNLFNVN